MKLIFLIFLLLVIAKAYPAEQEGLKLHGDHEKPINCGNTHQGGDGPHGHRLSHENQGNTQRCRCEQTGDHGDGPHGHRVKREHGDHENPCQCKCGKEEEHPGGDGPHGH